jgi:hypothetical protein
VYGEQVRPNVAGVLGQEGGHLGVCGSLSCVQCVRQQFGRVVGKDRYRACTQPLIAAAFSMFGWCDDDDTVAATRLAPTAS